ncbi:ABC transporter ATP-binding protein [Frigoribacterium faeni]|uniref:ABC transporter ATP-binding protein n=1 Tax=Frigoribacterium faeni TaxID=145483 RepID=UPI00141B9DF9|nr:ATP-binding cassette domain-containing protein [Frigoribacterium faeni]NIJ04418.1 ABC-2 type transport system ATP-binding protein [Frigoribacterium faeni]
MIEARSLTKRYGTKTALDDVSFTVRPGVVTGFLGPNGAGKSTTMRMIVGLDRPTSGSVTVNGRRYADHAAPLREVGVLLDAKAVHSGRSASDHLLAMAATHGIGKARVREVIALTGLEPVAKKRVGGFSLGMGQRLGIAAALLGDPATVILDEPVNGLDPEGVVWVRTLARHLASEGRTVFLSSHLMSEMAQTADHLIVLGRGRVLADAPVSTVIAQASGDGVRVRSPHLAQLSDLLRSRAEVVATTTDDGALDLRGVTAAQVGEAAAAQGIVLHELTPLVRSLEEAYMTLTQDSVEYHAGGTGHAGGAVHAGGASSAAGTASATTTGTTR